METSRPLFIPVILGAARMGRTSLHAARLVTDELGKRAGVETELIDIAKLPLPTNDAGEAIKQADFSANMDRADAVVVVSPEYNHGYSGLLKHVLDSCLKEYISQGGRDRGGVRWAVRRDASYPKSAPCYARDRPGNDFLGCKFLERPESICRGRQTP